MEHMAEVVPDADSQSLQHFISESDWDEREVLNQVAKEADAQLGGKEDSCLIVDESGFAKKGTKSVGVSRQWNGNKGKVDNSQVGVFIALNCGNRATLIDEQLYLPEAWTDDKQRCLDAGIPGDKIIFKQKQEQALEMIYRAKNNGIRYNWVGCDGFYGEDPAFLRMLDFQNEIFMADVHKDQRIYLKDPKPVVPQRKSKRGKAPSRLKAQTQAIRVDKFVQHQPSNAWQKVKIRDSSKGVVSAEILHQRVWLWDGEEEQAHNWHLIIKREINSPKTIKYSLSNADKETSQERLAFMQGQRYWVEDSIKNGKQSCGLSDYQVRKWRGFHHHMALSLMVMLFMLEERQKHEVEKPLLSCSDIRILLSHFLPRRDVTTDEVMRQMEVRHRKRQSSIDSAQRIKKITLLL